MLGFAASTTSRAGAPNSRAAEPPPNIVFVLADDLSTNLVRYMPHVLALERRGMTFSNYTVTDSLCCPSRASIFTGNYPHDTHVLTNELPDGGFYLFHQRGEEARTFATVLQQAGYRTALMGKYLNSYNPRLWVDGQRPYVPPGWSSWDVSNDNGYRGFGYFLTDDHTLRRFGTGPAVFLNSVLDRRAQGFVDSASQSGEPFLLEVATYTPHFPYAVAPRDRGTFRGVRAPRGPAFNRLPTHPPAWLQNKPPLTPAEIAQIDTEFRKRVESVQSIDRMIGNLEETLRRDGEADNTMFVFSSDNGYHMGEYRLAPGKLTPFDVDIRVPLVVAGPGIPAGVTNDEVVQNIDLAPTFESIANASIPTPTDGRSVLPMLDGQHRPRWPDVALIEQYGLGRSRDDPDYQSGRSGPEHKYVAIRSPTFLYVEHRRGEIEYYDLRTDPYEIHNLAYSLTGRQIRRLHRTLTALENCHDATECRRAGHIARP